MIPKLKWKRVEAHVESACGRFTIVREDGLWALRDARRPDAKTAWENLFLAGDWTATGLPATIEGTIRSGYRAADLVSESA